MNGFLIPRPSSWQANTLLGHWVYHRPKGEFSQEPLVEMLATHHWAVLKTSGSPKFLWIFPPPALNVSCLLALQTLGEHQGTRLQPLQRAHPHRVSPLGRERKLVGVWNHPHANLLFPLVIFPSLFFSSQNTLSKRNNLPESFLGEWTGEAVVPLLYTGAQILQKPLSSCLALCRGLTFFSFCVLLLQCKIGELICLHLHLSILGQINSPTTMYLQRGVQDRWGRRGRKGRFLFLSENQTVWPKSPFLSHFFFSPPYFIFSIFT